MEWKQFFWLIYRLKNMLRVENKVLLWSLLTGGKVPRRVDNGKPSSSSSGNVAESESQCQHYLPWVKMAIHYNGHFCLSRPHYMASNSQSLASASWAPGLQVSVTTAPLWEKDPDYDFSNSSVPTNLQVLKEFSALIDDLWLGVWEVLLETLAEDVPTADSESSF